jgi:anti-sigma B factor antagonist
VIKRSEFEIRAEHDHEHGARLVVCGDLDLATVPELQTAFERLLSADPAKVSLDLRGLTFADSSGVRLLIELTDRAREGSCELEIVRPPAEAYTVFRISGADVELPFVDG